ncbi:hypothetical protein AYL99_11646 [Fonsecaea erecta]|uniref:Ubiquitin-like domain-containing protein n=1 Tax=Fonsecaea erecta TaxID=1367422 RepID=A0A178Z3K2_9EURO|nr:hypothetical protein AYL99_11646 [Fonsecaea erecta]OAP54111.1 hypothetical protein AYL99_11646 [Fonsecaea erecta]
MTENGQGSPNGAADAPPAAIPGKRFLNLRVTDGDNQIYFKIRGNTKLNKLMQAFCERQGKDSKSARFLFDGQKLNPGDTPDQLDMEDGDMIEVQEEQIGVPEFLELGRARRKICILVTPKERYSSGSRGRSSMRSGSSTFAAGLSVSAERPLMGAYFILMRYSS